MYFDSVWQNKKKNRRQIVIDINYIKESIKTTPLAKYLLIKSDVSFRIELLRKKKIHQKFQKKYRDAQICKLFFYFIGKQDTTWFNF